MTKLEAGGINDAACGDVHILSGENAGVRKKVRKLIRKLKRNIYGRI